MKQICKRLSVIFLALTIISGSVFTTGIVVNADTYKVIFSDDFESYELKTSGAANKNAMNAKGWNTTSNTQGNYNTGSAYEIPHNKGTTINLAKVQGGSEWTDYSVQATITFLPVDGAAGLTRAGVTGRLYNEEHNKGYDLIVRKDEIADTVAKLQLRCDGEVIAEADISELKNDVAFVLRLEFRGTKIYGYLNHELMLSHDTANDAVKYVSGWSGIRKVDQAGMKVRYDDYIVSEIVPGTYPDGYLYYTNFEDAALSDASDPFEAIGFISTGKNKIENGEVFLNAGNRAYLTKVVGALDWTDYTVEADVQITKGDSDTATKGNAGIIARSSNENNDGYEFSMNYSGSTRKVSLTKRNGETSALGDKAYAFEFNTYYKLTMTVQGNSIMCWINDELVFDVEDTDAVTYETGYAGFRSTGKATADYLNGKIDNFSVKKYVAPEVVYPDGYSYFNDFETSARMKSEGWYSDNGVKADGVYTIDGGTYNYLTGVKDSSSWTDYVVEADVMIIDDGTTDQYAAIVGRSTNKTSEGYELRLIKESSGNTVLRLYKRGISSGKINDKVNKVNVTWEEGKMNRLKMVFHGADIYCYYNGEIVFEVTDGNSPYLTGYAGIHAAAGTAKSSYDNFTVREIQATDYPTDAVYPSGYLYYNDFSALRALNKEGWRSTGTKKNGAYLLKAESYNYLTNVEGSTEWTDYVVEADVTLHDNGEVPQYTAISARSNNLTSDGYQLRLIKEEDGDTVVRLYKRGITSGVINGVVNKINVSVIPNEKHTLKMVVQGATIICYFDGVKLFEVTDETDPWLTGYAGVHSAAGTADSSFEYFAVREIGDDDIVKDTLVQKQDGDIWFYDNFLGEESMTERGWSSDKVAIRNGAALITTRVVADKVQGADKWTDYEVSAIVYVDKEAGMLSETASSGAATVVARSLSSTTGYEFGIISSPGSDSYLRLYDRKNAVSLAEDETTKITDGEHELRMVCIGKEIYCFMDGNLIFAVQSDSATAGYAGVRVANYNTYYKNFTVRTARPVSATITPSGTISPSTGDYGMNMAVIYAAALVFSFSMLGLIVTTVYSRKRK